MGQALSVGKKNSFLIAFGGYGAEFKIFELFPVQAGPGLVGKDGRAIVETHKCGNAKQNRSDQQQAKDCCGEIKPALRRHALSSFYHVKVNFRPTTAETLSHAVIESYSKPFCQDLGNRYQ